MKRAFLYLAMLAIGTFGVTATAAARDHDGNKGRHHEARDFRNRDRDRGRQEVREHRREEFRTRENRYRDQRRDWDARHRHHRDNGKHMGWQKGRGNPHQTSLLRARPRPVGGPHTSEAHHVRYLPEGK